MKIEIEIEDDVLAAIDKSVKVIGQSRDFAFATAARWWLDSMPKVDFGDIDFSKIDDPDGKILEAYDKEYGW
jgi:alkyl hydroperoxide reductase subunit AhpC